jgi:hypothetical protein
VNGNGHRLLGPTLLCKQFGALVAFVLQPQSRSGWLLTLFTIRSFPVPSSEYSVCYYSHGITNNNVPVTKATETKVKLIYMSRCKNNIHCSVRQPIIAMNSNNVFHVTWGQAFPSCERT